MGELTPEPQLQTSPRSADVHGEMPLERIVGLMQNLLSHFDLDSVLAEIVDTAKSLLGAELATLWLYQADHSQLVCAIPRRDSPITVAFGNGLVGTCAATRHLVNVPDVTADPRFLKEVDGGALLGRGSMLSVPMIDADGVLIGVLQLLDEDGLPFDARAESMAGILAAQAAIALQAVAMHQERLHFQRLNQEVELARAIQIGTLPETMPQVPGYEVHGHFQPADRAGGDLFDLVMLDGRLFILLGDATGHGFGPALSDTAPRGTLTFHSLREYTPGDDIRRVHWRSSARTGTLMVREHVDTSLPSTVVVLDTRANRYRDESFEDAVDVAASVVASSQARGFPVRLVTSTGVAFVARAGQRGQDLRDFLTTVETAGDGSLRRAAVEVLRGREHDVIAVVSGDVDGADLSEVTSMTRRFASGALVTVGAATSGTRPRWTAGLHLDGATAAEALARWQVTTTTARSSSGFDR